MKAETIENIKNFDKEGNTKKVVDTGLERLKEFRNKYPFAENPDAIEAFNEEDIFREKDKAVGPFVHYLEFLLIDIGHLKVYSDKVYLRIKEDLDTFKELLYIVVDKEKPLAEKVDANWKDIKGLGGDSHIAKKIIFCFNHERGEIAPIFKTKHLEYFLEKIVPEDQLIFPGNYEGLSLGEKYEFLMKELFKAKASNLKTNQWETTYFSHFLYETYPPPAIITPAQHKKANNAGISEQQLEFNQFNSFLNDLRHKDKISAEQMRTYRDQWFKNPEQRQSLIDILSATK